MFLDTSPVVSGLAHSLWLGALLYAGVVLALRWIPEERGDLRASLVTATIYLLPMLVVLVVLIRPEKPAVPHRGLFAYPGLSTTDFVFVAWMLGSGAMLVKLGMDLHSVRRLVSRSTPIGDNAFRRRFVRLAERCGLGSRVRCHTTAHVRSPCVVGIFRSVILIPFPSLSVLSPDELDAVILHELAHVRRFDALHSFFQEILKAAFFFNPFVYLLARIAGREREYACDAIAADLSGNPKTLAGALLRLGLTVNAPILELRSQPEQAHELLHRVRRLLQLPGKPPRRLLALDGVRTLTGLLGGVALWAALMTANAGLGRSDAVSVIGETVGRIIDTAGLPKDSRRASDVVHVVGDRVDLNGTPLPLPASREIYRVTSSYGFDAYDVNRIVLGEGKTQLWLKSFLENDKVEAHIYTTSSESSRVLYERRILRRRD